MHLVPMLHPSCKFRLTLSVPRPFPFCCPYQSIAYTFDYVQTPLHLAPCVTVVRCRHPAPPKKEKTNWISSTVSASFSAAVHKLKQRFCDWVAKGLHRDCYISPHMRAVLKVGGQKTFCLWPTLADCSRPNKCQTSQMGILFTAAEATSGSHRFVFSPTATVMRTCDKCSAFCSELCTFTVSLSFNPEVKKVILVVLVF